MSQIQRNPHFQAVRSHVDAMLAYGRGVVDGVPCPLFAGVVDVGQRKPVAYLTPPPPGIRISDFNWCGNNLMHDLPVMEVMNQLSELGAGEQYTAAVEAMYPFYGSRCPHPATGLFPWGEHAQWSFADQAILPCSFSAGFNDFQQKQYLTHDHLAFAPAWFWEGLWRHHPEAVTRFAHGLNWHIVEEATFEHNRHGALGPNWWHDPKKPATGTGKDFARHAGFFIFDCLFAYSKNGDDSLLDWSRKKLKWHLHRRLHNGIISGTARSKEEKEEGQHDSLALSLADAADVLGDTAAGREFRGYSEELLDARRRQSGDRPFNLPNCPPDGRLWIDGYFRKAPARLTPANVDLMVYRRTKIQWYADAIVEHARWLMENLKEPEPRIPVMARRFWNHLELMLDAYNVTRETVFLRFAAQIAEWAIRDLRRDDLFLGVSNIQWTLVGNNVEMHWDPWTEAKHPGYYYGVTSTNNLLRALLRLAMIQEDLPDTLGPDPYRR